MIEASMRWGVVRRAVGAAALTAVLVTGCGSSTSGTAAIASPSSGSAAVSGTAMTSAGPTGSMGSSRSGAASSSAHPGASSGAASGAAVVATTTGPLGTYLVDGQGRTLYMFESDANGTSSCTGGCATTWSPLTGTGKPTASAGAQPDRLTTITRADGTRQVVYSTSPLYTYHQDTAPGQTNGQGSGGKWWVVGVDGKPIKTAAGSAAPSSKTSG